METVNPTVNLMETVNPITGTGALTLAGGAKTTTFLSERVRRMVGRTLSGHCNCTPGLEIWRDGREAWFGGAQPLGDSRRTFLMGTNTLPGETRLRLPPLVRLPNPFLGDIQGHGRGFHLLLSLIR